MPNVDVLEVGTIKKDSVVVYAEPALGKILSKSKYDEIVAEVTQRLQPFFPNNKILVISPLNSITIIQGEIN